MNSPPTIPIVMLGTGDFALPTFEHLVAGGFHVVALVTQPERPQGRKRERIPSRIHQEARTRGIRVEQPEDVNAPEALEMLRDLGADLFVTAAYGQILSAELLQIPRLGGINLHGSILPKYRGAAPVARAIQRGETETGVTVIRMSPQVDAGGIVAIARTPIDPDETAGELEARLAILGAPLVASTIVKLVEETATVLPQDMTQVTKAPKLRKESGRISWAKPAQAVHNFVRAMQPWPVAYTFWHCSWEPRRQPERLIVHKTAVVEAQGDPGVVLEAQGDRMIVAAGQGAVRLLVVQLPGKKAMPVGEFLRGHHILVGDRMGAEAPTLPS